MDNYTLQGCSSADMALLGLNIDKQDKSSVMEISVAVAAPRITLITVTYGASTLLAGAASPLEGMKTLIVRNKGHIMARIGASSDKAIYEEGIELEPGCELRIPVTASAPPKLYGRSSGFTTVLEVIEV